MRNEKFLLKNCTYHLNKFLLQNIFFFQAEDGIRDHCMTGVQTCALPIWISFYSAFWTRNLDYAAFYKTIPRDEAYARVHRLLDATNATFLGDKYSITRTIAGDPAKPKYNVVILLEESLGSEFWGSLGRQNTLTPEM